ncbi:hypothetical protein Hanom_Chr10g00929911 [Helianthus anomalus]
MWKSVTRVAPRIGDHSLALHHQQSTKIWIMCHSRSVSTKGRPHRATRRVGGSDLSCLVLGFAIYTKLMIINDYLTNQETLGDFGKQILRFFGEF